MKVTVKAHPLAYAQKVEKQEDGSLVVWVKEPPVKGLANIAIKEALAEYFKVSFSEVRLVSGFRARTKVFEIQ